MSDSSGAKCRILTNQFLPAAKYHAENTAWHWRVARRGYPRPAPEEPSFIVSHHECGAPHSEEEAKTRRQSMGISPLAYQMMSRIVNPRLALSATFSAAYDAGMKLPSFQIRPIILTTPGFDLRYTLTTNVSATSAYPPWIRTSPGNLMASRSIRLSPTRPAAKTRKGHRRRLPSRT